MMLLGLALQCFPPAPCRSVFQLWLACTPPVSSFHFLVVVPFSSAPLLPRDSLLGLSLLHQPVPKGRLIGTVSNGRGPRENG